MSFQDRVRYQLTVAAVAVMVESNATASHALRVAYANAVIGGTADLLGAAVVVLTNSTLAAAVTLAQADFGIADSDLPFVVNSVFNALAGVAT